MSVDDERFLEAQRRLQAYSAEQMAGLKALLGAFAVPATGIVVYRDGHPAASGLMAIADGIVVTGNVVTDQNRRREGLASAMMRTGFAWAHAAGARWAALNVQADNDGAKALYQSLGFSHQYDYLYRIPGAPA
jgi:ribosomal protein S18 acetylase RimI-like enzyme